MVKGIPFAIHSAAAIKTFSGIFFWIFFFFSFFFIVSWSRSKTHDPYIPFADVLRTGAFACRTSVGRFPSCWQFSRRTYLHRYQTRARGVVRVRIFSPRPATGFVYCVFFCFCFFNWSSLRTVGMNVYTIRLLTGRRKKKNKKKPIPHR